MIRAALLFTVAAIAIVVAALGAEFVLDIRAPSSRLRLQGALVTTFLMSLVEYNDPDPCLVVDTRSSTTRQMISSIRPQVIAMMGAMDEAAVRIEAGWAMTGWLGCSRA